MTEQRKIDTSMVEELGAIKEKRLVIEQRLVRLEEERSKVSDEVFERVQRDYQAQHQELASLAAPLEEKARAEFVELSARLEAAREAAGRVKLDIEEIEFRHRLGEFDKKELDRRLAEANGRLEKEEGALAQILEIEAAFVAAFDSREDLEGGPQASPEKKQAAPPKPPTPPPPPEMAGGTVIISATDLGPAGDLAVGSEPSPDGDAEIPAMESDAVAGGTVVLPNVNARLEVLEPEQHDGPPEYIVEPVTFIGRSADNQVRIDRSEVSRRHTQINFTEEGYLLTDLGSENGSYVNGERVEKHLLKDGDRVQIGSVRFLFHA